MTTFKWHATVPLTAQHARQFWQVRYEHEVTPWDRGAPSPALEGWLATGRLEPCRILVPGCGQGHEVVALARRGFEVTAVDIAPAAVSAARRRLEDAGVDAELVRADLMAWSPPRLFDAIYEQTALCALVPEQWPAYAQRLAAWLRPGGPLLALFMQTGRPGGPPFHCDLAAMRQLFPAGRWRWPDAAPETVAHPSGFFELGVVIERA